MDIERAFEISEPFKGHKNSIQNVLLIIRIFLPVSKISYEMTTLTFKILNLLNAN